MSVPDTILRLYEKPIIISVFDWSGAWSEPYAKAGYRVLMIDLKWGIDAMNWDYTTIPMHLVKGVLLAPPCTHYTVSGAQYWKEKDQDGRTLQMNRLVEKALQIAEYFCTEEDDFWVMENPVGRLARMLRGEYRAGEWEIMVPDSLKAIVVQPAYKFDPCDHGDAWTKKTLLWGKFNKPKRNKVAPIYKLAKNGDRYSPIHMATGGRNDRAQSLRSITPPGFAKAFFEANNPAKL